LTVAGEAKNTMTTSTREFRAERSTPSIRASRAPGSVATALRTLLAAVVSQVAYAQVTQPVAIGFDGTSPPTSGGSLASIAISHDGRFVAFQSFATNLVPGDVNGQTDVFVRDRWLGVTEIVSISTAGVQGDKASGIDGVAISGDGRFVVFASKATTLVPGAPNHSPGIYLRDRSNGTTERVSLDAQGNEAIGVCGSPSVSDDGRYVAFHSAADHLVVNDSNGKYDVFVRDRLLATTELVSVATNGASGNDSSLRPSMSPDGRYIAFDSGASNLDPNPNNSGQFNIFVRDRTTGTTELASVSMLGFEPGGSSYATISADGRYVAFESGAHLVATDTNSFTDVYVRDRVSGITNLVTIGWNGAPANHSSISSLVPGSISADGRFVAYYSFASNLVPVDQNLDYDVFVTDRANATTELVSATTSGVQGNSASESVAISADGRFVAFASNATNLFPGGSPSGGVFVRDRNASGATSVCDPGVNGVIACPCANAPSGPGRGCDNSSATGGASLGASGFAYLSMDSLVFATSSEKPTATSIVLQGNAANASGVVFGQGVRCVDGLLKRLYTTTASAGSITAPNFGAGDPTVSARSSALGDVISAGQSRWYLVYYRDPIVLGGCSAGSTFNATQTVAIAWSL
jgi:Tol biopolymer transport system component